MTNKMMDHAIEVQRNERRSVFEEKEGGLGEMAGFSSWGAAGTDCWLLLAGGCNLRPSGIGWYLNASQKRDNRKPSQSTLNG